jgi:hypothetical protein
MGRFPFKADLRSRNLKGEKDTYWFLEDTKFEKFNSDILGLGKIDQPSNQIDALACVFDLSGFTSFCSQTDPHLVIPEYLNNFLNWLFSEIRNESVEANYKGGKRLWTELPFLAKFLGDGVLFLWNCKNMEPIDMCNVIVVLWKICEKYRETFYPTIKKVVAEPPELLRCRIARSLGHDSV